MTATSCLGLGAAAADFLALGMGFTFGAANGLGLGVPRTFFKPAGLGGAGLFLTLILAAADDFLGTASLGAITALEALGAVSILRAIWLV